MGTSRAHKAETGIEASGLLREVQEKFLVPCKDGLQSMYRYIIILIVSVSNNLLMVTIKFISLCCVCQSSYAAGPPKRRVDCLAFRLKWKQLNGLIQILGETHTTIHFNIMASMMAYNILGL